MLYWICPECGYECSPAIRECPTCTAPPVPPPVPKQTARDQAPANRIEGGQDLLSLAQTFQSSPPVPLLAPAPQRQLLPAAANGHELTAGAAAVLTAEEPKEPELSKKFAALDDMAIRPARPAGLAPVKQSLEPVPVRLSSPAVLPPAAPTRAAYGLALAGPAPVGDISFQAKHWDESGAVEQPAEPLPTRRRSVAFVRAEMPGPDHSGMPVAELEQVTDIRLKPTVPSSKRQPTNDGNGVSEQLAYGASAPALAPLLLKPAGESLAELLTALKTSAEERDRAAIQAIQASFHEKPSVSLLSAPAEILTAPAPPAGQWMRAGKTKLTAVMPEIKGRAAVVVGPCAPTLAGPCLPPQLLNLDLRNSSLRHPKRAPSWMISLLVATVVILGAAGLSQYMAQDRDTTAASTAAPAHTVKAAPAPVRVVQEHPSARSVEVAGVRIVAGPNKKPQIEYLVINHSSSELTGLNIRIAVRSVEALAEAPLFSVSNAIASLGPNQSKEIRTDLDSSIQPSVIPDWQSLRTEILIARQ